MPQIRDHWSTNKFLGSKVNQIMSVTHYKFISRYFHLMDNTKKDGSVLYKIKILLEIIKTWNKFYYPSNEIALDETIPFYGRSKYTNYSPQKPEKWGYKENIYSL